MTAKKRKKPANQDVTAPLNESADPAGSEVADIGSSPSVRSISADKQSETTSPASEKKFKDLVEITTDWVWEVDRDGVYTYVSPKVRELLGYDVGEVLGKTPFDLMPEKEAERIGEFFRERVAKNEAFYRLENINRHKDGHLVILETSGIPVFDEEGHLKGYRGIDRDITERKKTEDALRESEQQLKDIFENTAVGMYRTTPDGRIIMANPALVRMLGFSSFEQLSQRNLEDEGFEPCYARSEFKERIESQGQIVGLESQWITQDGTTLVVIESARVVRDESGRILYYEGTAEDITERKRAAEELRIRNEILDIFLTIPDEQMYSEILNVVLKALRSEYGTFGYFNEDGSFTVPAITREIYWEKCNVPDKEIIFQRGTFSGIWNRAIKERKTLHSNKGPFNTPEGHIPIKNTMVTPICYRDKLLSAIHVANKPTDYDERDKALMETIADHIAPILYARLEREKEEKDRKEAEEALRQAHGELEERVRERTAALTEAHKKLLQDIYERRRMEKDILDISEREQRRIGQELHDSLGQQLTGIAIMSKVLEQKLKIKSIEESAEAQEIGRLLNQAAEQTRKLAKGLHPVDLDASGLMSALQELAVTTEQLFGIRCTFDCDEPVPISNAAVAVHLYRIAQEAVTNAIKHGHAENIVLRLTPDRDMLTLIIESDGLDFPEVLPKNKGMGLHIMNYRAEMIDGTLDIHRGARGGTIVTCAFADQRPDENEKQDYGREKTAK